MKATVTKYLNVRVGKPSVNAPCYQYLAPGSELEIDGKQYKGDVYNGTDIWVKDLLNNYYWLGGLTLNEQSEELSVTPPVSNLVNYSDLLNLAQVTPANRGAGVNIALLDTGVAVKHRDLKNVIVESKSFVTGQNAILDNNGHGTMMAGLIAGQGNADLGIRGIAQDCHIYNYKVINDSGSTNMAALKAALNYILLNNHSLNIKIINMSLSVSNFDLIEKEIERLNQNENIKVVVAGGDDGQYKYGVTRLASSHHTFGVGAINNQNAATSVPSSIGCFYFNQSLYSCSSESQAHYREAKGDSLYTALTSGLFALGLADNQVGISSYLQDRINFDAIKISPYR